MKDMANKDPIDLHLTVTAAIMLLWVQFYPERQAFSCAAPRLLNGGAFGSRPNALQTFWKCPAEVVEAVDGFGEFVRASSQIPEKVKVRTQAEIVALCIMRVNADSRVAEKKPASRPNNPAFALTVRCSTMCLT
jgi:hypothetical protein